MTRGTCCRLWQVMVLIEEFHAIPNLVDRWGCTPLDESIRARHAAVEEYINRLLKDSEAIKLSSKTEIENVLPS